MKTCSSNGIVKIYQLTFCKQRVDRVHTQQKGQVGVSVHLDNPLMNVLHMMYSISIDEDFASK